MREKRVSIWVSTLQPSVQVQALHGKLWPSSFYFLYYLLLTSANLYCQPRVKCGEVRPFFWGENKCLS